MKSLPRVTNWRKSTPEDELRNRQFRTPVFELEDQDENLLGLQADKHLGAIGISFFEGTDRCRVALKPESVQSSCSIGRPELESEM